MPRPDEMPRPYVSWLAQVGEFVRRPDLFRPNPEVCDIWEDSDAVDGFDNLYVIQFCIRTAVYQLEAALAMHSAGAPPSAVPALVRAALETGAQAYWLLSPDTSQERVERYLRVALQESFDQKVFEGPSGEQGHENRRAVLMSIAARIGRNEAYFDRARRYSLTRAVAEVGESSGATDLPSFWSLLSGLAHGRKWSIDAVGERHPLDTSDGLQQTGVPRAQFGLYQLRAAEVLDDATGLWNIRANVLETTSAAPRLARDSDGRAVGLGSQPHSWIYDVGLRSSLGRD